jgi:hypothetical protein
VCAPGGSSPLALHERVDPEVMLISAGGIYPQCIRLQLAARVGERALIDGSTGRTPGDLTVWEFEERERREQVLALDLEQLECVSPAHEIVHRS